MTFDIRTTDLVSAAPGFNASAAASVRRARADIHFLPLSVENLQQAVNISTEIFGDNDKNILTQEFRASLGLEPENENIRDRMGIGPAAYFLPHADGKPVGITGYYTIEGQEQDSWLGWVGVTKDFRGKGMGRHLVEGAFEKAAENGIENFRIWTTTAPEYADACKMYAKLGYDEAVYDRSARDAASLVRVFSKAVAPGVKATPWEQVGYGIDAEGVEIPYLNKLHGFVSQRPRAIGKIMRTPARILEEARGGSMFNRHTLHAPL